MNIKSADKIALELLHQLNEKCSKNYRYSLSMLIINPFIIVFEIISLYFWFCTFIKIIKDKWNQHKKEESNKDTLIKPKEKEEEKEIEEVEEDFDISSFKEAHTEIHPHILSLTYRNAWSCDVCHELFRGCDSYYCKICDYDACPKCYFN